MYSCIILQQTGAPTRTASSKDASKSSTSSNPPTGAPSIVQSKTSVVKVTATIGGPSSEKTPTNTPGSKDNNTSQHQNEQNKNHGCITDIPIFLLLVLSLVALLYK